MTQIALPSKQGSSFWGVETVFGTTGSPVRAFPTSIEITPEQTNIKVEEERNRGKAHQKPVQSLKRCSGKISWLIKPDGTQLTAAASPATPWGNQPFKTLWGGEQSGAGSTVQSSSTTTSVIVGSGHGSRFAVGTWIAVEVSGELEPTKVIAISTDTLTVWPQLSGTPTTSGLVVNSYTCYPTDAYAVHNASTSLTFQHAKAATGVTGYGNYEWTLNGCTGNIDVAIERDKLIQATWNLKGASWTGPSSQSLTVSAGTDAMSTGMPVRTGTVLVQALSSTSRTHVSTRSIAIQFAEENQLIEEMEGTTEGIVGVQKVPVRPAATVTLKQLADTSIDTNHYVSQTSLAVIFWTKYGSGTTARFVGFEFPTMVVAEKPKMVDDGGIQHTEWKLEALEDEKITSATTDLAKAAYRMFTI